MTASSEAWTMTSTLHASILDGLRLAIRAVKTGPHNPDLVRGIAFAVVAESLQFPPGDPVRVRLEAAVQTLLHVAPTVPEQLAALQAVRKDLVDL
jgi:hypothetical protein